MALTEFQKNTLLHLYAHAIEYSPTEENRVDLIFQLWNAFSYDIPDWQNRIRTLFEEKGFGDSLAALDSALESDDFISKPAEDGDHQHYRQSWIPFYRPRAEVEEDIYRFEQKKFNYCFAMVLADTMYNKGLLNDGEYEIFHNEIAVKYGIGPNSILRWEGPKKTSPEKPQKKHRRNKSYQKHDKEYWANRKK